MTGRPVDLRSWEPDPSSPNGISDEYLLRVAVDEVIKGEPINDEPGFIDRTHGSIGSRRRETSVVAVGSGRQG